MFRSPARNTAEPGEWATRPLTRVSTPPKTRYRRTTFHHQPRNVPSPEAPPKRPPASAHRPCDNGHAEPRTPYSTPVAIAPLSDVRLRTTCTPTPFAHPRRTTDTPRERHRTLRSPHRRAPASPRRRTTVARDAPHRTVPPGRSPPAQAPPSTTADVAAHPRPTGTVSAQIQQAPRAPPSPGHRRRKHPATATRTPAIAPSPGDARKPHASPRLAPRNQPLPT